MKRRHILIAVASGLVGGVAISQLIESGLPVALKAIGLIGVWASQTAVTWAIGGSVYRAKLQEETS